MWFDALAHLDDPRVTDVPGVLARAAAAGVSAVVTATVEPQALHPSQYGRVEKAAAEAGIGVGRAWGIHPAKARWGSASQGDDGAGRAQNDGMLATLRERLSPAWPRVSGSAPAVAIGEIGLDGRPGMPDMAAQQTLFEAQLELARQLELPVIIHCVRAWQAFWQSLERQPLPAPGGMVHGYSGSAETALHLVKLGLGISFGGMVTRAEARRCRAAAVVVPAEHLLIESDTPDHPPATVHPALSEPASVVAVAQTLAQLRGESVEALARHTSINAKRLFGGL